MFGTQSSTASKPPGHPPHRLRPVVDARFGPERADEVVPGRARLAVTSAPRALATCTATWPTPPAAPFTSTLLPSPTWPRLQSVTAVAPTQANAAASDIAQTGRQLVREVDRNRGELGKRSTRAPERIDETEHSIAVRKPRDAGTDRSHVAGEIRAHRPRYAAPHEQAKAASRNFPVHRVQARGVDTHEHLARCGHRNGNVFETDFNQVADGVVAQREHAQSSGCRRRAVHSRLVISTYGAVDIPGSRKNVPGATCALYVFPPA